MSGQDRKVSIRTSEEEFDTIQILAEKNGYPNVSEFVRTAVGLLIQAQMVPQHMKSLVIQVPIGLYDRAERLVKTGEGRTVEEEIVKSFESYIENKIDRKYSEGQRLEALEGKAFERDQRRNIFDMDQKNRE